MIFEHLPGTTVILLNGDFKPAGDVEIESYREKDKTYQVWWTYEQTGESELIKVPEWHLQKKRNF